MKTKPTIKQAIVKALKALKLNKSIKNAGEYEAEEAFKKVCTYMNNHQELQPRNLSDIDIESLELYAEDGGIGYTLGAQVADVYLTEIVPHLDIEPGDFGAEDFYQVGEQLWDEGEGA